MAATNVLDSGFNNTQYWVVNMNKLMIFLNPSNYRLMKACLTYSVLLGAVLTAPIASSAAVTSLSPEAFAQYGKENAFWEVTVSCEGSDVERIIQRKTDADSWCPKGAENLCSEERNEAAKNACGDDYSALLDREVRAKQEQADQERLARQQRAAEEERQRAQAAAASKARAKPTISPADAKLRSRISIQEQRIKLDQEKLELRRRELALERRAIEIEEILETLE